MTRPDLALVPAALGCWVVALVVVLFPQSGFWVAVSAWVGTALASVWMLRTGRSGLGVLSCALVAVVATGIAWQEPQREQARTAASSTVRVTGTVVSKVAPAWAGAWRASIAPDHAEWADAAFSADVGVVFTGERPEGFDLGAAVSVVGRAELARAGERNVLVVRAARDPIVVRPPPGIFAPAAFLRSHYVALSARFPSTGAQLMPGLAVGDTSSVTEELDADMKAASLSHLTAVSGSNCAVVVAAMFGLAALCRAPRWVRVVCATVGLGCFVVLVTPEPSVVRAATMSGIAMLCVLLGKRRAGTRLLSLAVCLLLIIDPWLATSIGFILSVAATSALLLLAVPLADRLSVVMPVPLAYVLAVPTAAQLACAPILVLLTPSISTYGVLANMIAAPAAPLATVAGLLACLAASIPIVGVMLGALAWVPAQWIGVTATFVPDLPIAQVPWLPGGFGAALLAVVTAALVVVISRWKARTARGMAVGILAVTVGTVLGTVGVRTVVVPVTTPDGWSVAMCDVGQGDALFVRSEGAVLAIDTGREPAAVDACRVRLGVARIDMLVLTHFDADHAGGSEAWVGRVGTVLHGPPESAADSALLEHFKAGGAHLVHASRGLSGVLGAASWRVLWPMNAERSGNDGSVVVEIGGPGVPRSLFLGDLGAEVQHELLATGAVQGQFDVVKVSHHGSADQYEPLYTEAKASVALIGVGADNEYGHPRADTLQMLARHGYTSFRTDTDGLVLVSEPDGEEIRVWREVATREAAPAPP